MYLLLITIGLCASYFGLLFLFSFFFNNEPPKISRNFLRSVMLIFFLSCAGYAVVYSIPNIELGNRVLHAFGGGFMAFLVCFLVYRDMHLPITKFQFFVLSILIVTALGVANEITECILQNATGFIFSASINDTWLDLVSNTIGSFVAALFFVPFINREKTALIQTTDIGTFQKE